MELAQSQTLPFTSLFRYLLQEVPFVPYVTRIHHEKFLVLTMVARKTTAMEEGRFVYLLFTFWLPLAHNIASCIHTNLLGACEELRKVLKNTDAGQLLNNDQPKSKVLAIIVNQQGELQQTKR